MADDNGVAHEQAVVDAMVALDGPPGPATKWCVTRNGTKMLSSLRNTEEMALESAAGMRLQNPNNTYAIARVHVTDDIVTTADFLLADTRDSVKRKRVEKYQQKADARQAFWAKFRPKAKAATANGKFSCTLEFDDTYKDSISNMLLREKLASTWHYPLNGVVYCEVTWSFEKE
jgi:hypothetical protein